jgi:ubiquinone biosynthesis protein
MISDAREGLHVFLLLARQLPDLAKRADRLMQEIETMAESGLRLDGETTRALGKAHRTFSRWGHVALWIIALTLLWACWRVF